MSILSLLMEKPWLKEQAAVDDLHDGRSVPVPVEKLGLRVFLAVVTVLFSLSIAAYTERLRFPDWTPLPMPWLLWLNTAVLILGSVALQKARNAANRGRIDSIRPWLLAGGLLTMAFLFGQYLVWQQLDASGYYASENPANGFFYLLTALHGLHLVGGLVAWSWITARMWQGIDLDRTRLSVELCAIYWHFLLLIWVILFVMLLVT